MSMSKKISHGNLEGGISNLTSLRIFKYAFTLAEMMVVMLILSIVMAAFAPVMTTRNKVDLSSPWKYIPENNSDIYYGLGVRQTAYIGQYELVDTDPVTRLMINTSSVNQNHIAFKRGDKVLGQLYLTENSIILGHGRQTGSNNTVVGSGSFAHNTTGSENIAVGFSTLVANTTGSSNVAVGDSALLENTSGTNNSAIGTALMNNTTGSKNTSIGDDTLVANTRGSENVALGVNALRDNTTGSQNIALGNLAMANSTASGRNIAIGYNALQGATTPNIATSNTVSIGSQVQLNTAVGQNSIAIGTAAKAAGENGISMGNASNASYSGAISIGKDSGSASADSVAIGTTSKATGSQAIAIGSNAQATNSQATALGYNAKASGNYSAALGYNTQAIGSWSTALGYGAVASANESIAIGDVALASGANGVALGYGAKANGTNVTAIGSSACSNVTGANKVCLGQGSGPEANSDIARNSESWVYLGNRNSTVRIPGNVLIEGNVWIQGATYMNLRDGGHKNNFIAYEAGRHTNNDNPYLEAGNKNNWGHFNRGITPGSERPYSDIRLKNLKGENKSGLAKIRQLKVFNFTFKDDKTKTPHVGVIAQELQKVFPEAVSKDEKGYLFIRMEDMFYSLLNAVKELDAKVTLLINQESAKDKKIKELEARLDRLEKKIK